MTTPARLQYLGIKAEHPDEILLFRMGDFYETFDADAEVVAKVLEIALTSREFGKGERVPLAGIPYHALNTYLGKLVKAGHRVALCEQTSDPATSKGLVDREVVRVVTPGTVVEDYILDPTSNSYLASVYIEDGQVGLAYADITTSEFATGQFSVEVLNDELTRLSPAELLVPERPENGGPGLETGDRPTVALPPHLFGREAATETLKRQFRVGSLEPFGCERLPLAVRAAGALIEYLGKSNQAALAQITGLTTYSVESHMVLDPQTIRNLELFEGGRWGDRTASLTSVLDDTRTSMGARLLRRWVGMPLLDITRLQARLDAVAWFHASALRRGGVAELLAGISDIERLVNRVRGATATPRDLAALKDSLRLAPQLRGRLSDGEDAEQVSDLTARIGTHGEVVDLIDAAIADDPPLSVGQGRVIRRGYSSELDGIRDGAKSARDYIAGLEAQERERTGVKSLKVGFNKVFGYYIEISKANTDRVPDDYIRRQTLVNAERYVTGEMKEYESRVLNAQERVAEVEVGLFRNVCSEVARSADQVLVTGRALARVDVLRALGDVAASRNYVRPLLTTDTELVIEQGRHPVVEKLLPPGRFVPNDSRLATQDEQLVVLTGPNMAGKSTFIRQVAIIALMAQIGSFVPARSATVGLVDRIFTRVGMQDDLTVGQSTFMVEMVETAAILNHATERSLIILDEIGRGTSTYDGLAIARATAEYIHNHPGLGCRTLFATHYHELTALAQTLPRVRNHNVSVAEEGGEVVFLHRIVPGGADRSYGVHVARLAGLPPGVIDRAWDVLAELERSGSRNGPAAETPPATQMSFLSDVPAVLKELLELDPSAMTPLEAITRLYELKERARDQS
jgi:DNA mismatch repair protein MutS